MPHVIVIAGPNGAGKSTHADSILRGELGVTHFVNADTIARGLSAFDPGGVAFEAGRIMLQRVRQLAEERQSFAFETTLAGRSFADWIVGLRPSGYSFLLAYFWLPSPDVSVQRVADRVRRGGHGIPEETIRRRYFRSLSNFFRLYRPIADEWQFFDNGGTSGPRLIASGSMKTESVVDVGTWAQVKELAREQTADGD